MTQIAHCAGPVLISALVDVFSWHHYNFMCVHSSCLGGFLQVRSKTDQLEKVANNIEKNVSCPLEINYHTICVSTAYLKLGLSFSHCGVIPNLDA